MPELDLVPGVHGQDTRSPRRLRRQLSVSGITGPRQRRDPDSGETSISTRNTSRSGVVVTV